MGLQNSNGKLASSTNSGAPPDGSLARTVATTTGRCRPAAATRQASDRLHRGAASLALADLRRELARLILGFELEHRLRPGDADEPPGAVGLFDELRPQLCHGPHDSRPGDHTEIDPVLDQRSNADGCGITVQAL